MNNIEDFDPKDWKITKFYPYTSHVHLRIAKTRSNDIQDPTFKFTQHFKEIAEDELDIQWDNKVVLKVEYINKWDNNVSHSEYAPLYLGYYDGARHIGLGIYQSSKCTTSLNKTFV